MNGLINGKENIKKETLWTKMREKILNATKQKEKLKCLKYILGKETIRVMISLKASTNFRTV